ncbi:MAG: ArnT family glycosyltransferase [Chthoniobacterales bacterium]
MTTGARTFGLDETLIEPRVLPPPPTRHALFVFLLVLASIVHIGTAGWSDLHNGAEGHYASAAREMFRSGSWVPPGDAGSDISHEPPLLYWLLGGSFHLFGVSAAAARFPIAGATIVSVALTFLIGERLAGYWRGFIAGLMHLCCLGTFVWGRIVTREPVSAALLGAAIFCATCGYQRQRERRWWFAGVWFFAALGCLNEGVAGLLLPAGILWLLAVTCREARSRFRRFFDWRSLLLFAAVVLPWRVFAWWHGGHVEMAEAQGMPLQRFLLVHLAWWFPLLLLVLPGLLLAPRRIFRPHEFDFADALPLAWMAIVFLPLLFVPGREDYQSLPMWSALALWSAGAWDRIPRALRLAGIALTMLAGVLLVVFALLGSAALPVLPPSPWPSARTVVALIGCALLGSCGVAAFFAWRNREELAIGTIMLGMVTIGLGAAEAMARSGAQFSLAETARYVQPRLGASGEVWYEGTPRAGSSLGFYLERPPLMVDARHFDAGAVLERFSALHPVYLVIKKERVPFWQRELTERFHVYHQVASCGAHVVVDNQP